MLTRKGLRIQLNTGRGGRFLRWGHASCPPPLLLICQAPNAPANIFPINTGISVIWKDKGPAASLALAGAFPIMEGYRKWESVENR